MNQVIDTVFDVTHFFDISHDLMCIAGFDGYFRRINPSVIQTLGYSEDELYSRPIDDFVHPDDLPITRQSRQQVIQGTPLLHFENRYLTKAGETVWLAWTSMPLASEKLIYAIAKIITPKKQIEADRNALLTKLTQLNAEMRQLTYTASHDLRAPVHNLVALFDLLNPDNISHAESRYYLELLKSATDVLRKNLNQHIEQLLHQDSVNLGRKKVDLSLTLQRVKNSLLTLIEQSGTDIQADFQAFSSINFNPSYLESIFLNLISNSIKYARPGHSPQITIQARLAGEIQQLVFSDNGLGFDLERVQDKLFGLHQTFHNHPDSKGIGLYLVYNHLNSLGGHISLNSQPGQGSTFTLSFKP